MTKCFVGCSGFHYHHWISRFYPEDLPKDKWLQFYSERFSTVELNSTFYHQPPPKTFQGWNKKTPKNFRFAVKASRFITHIKRFNNVKASLKRCYDSAAPLKEKLAAFLFQLPPSMKYSPQLLNKIIRTLDSKKPNFIEFRNNSWFNDEVYKKLRRASIGCVVVSGPKIKEEVLVTSADAYIRFHGKEGWYNYDYSDSELKQWAKIIKKLKAKNVFAYFNNDADANAVKNAKYLESLVKK